MNFERKLEEIRKRRLELDKIREAEREEQRAGGNHLPDPEIAKNRNAQLTLEVQKEMARLRTLWPSPLLLQLHQMRDDYLNA